MTSNQQISSHEFVLLVVSRQKWTNLIFGHMRLQSRKKKPKPTVVNIESIHFVLYFNHYHVFSFIYIRNELWPFTSYRQKIQWVNLAAKYAIRSRRMNYLTLVYRSHIHVYCYHLMSSEHRESVCSFECYVDWSKVQLVWWGAQNDKNKVKMLNKIRFRFNVLTNRKKWFPCVFFWFFWIEALVVLISLRIEYMYYYWNYSHYLFNPNFIVIFINLMSFQFKNFVFTQSIFSPWHK